MTKIANAVTKGRLATLYALRDVLAADADEAGPNMRVQIGVPLQKLLAEIDELERAEPEESASDDIARELKAGLADASVVQIAGRRRKSGTG